ncbi:helix-turn-helix domain-containing protein [Mycobacterium leprae]|uniref:winged helix-turn-helix domain-containing protein n=2 Tax=Mycobacterium leprae TaxID=1769 RepID=UPI0022AA89CB|nr:helix-turn-helix domain-containing protein [Mycobacterium leprae]
MTRTRLMHEIWSYDCNDRIRTVGVHVRRLQAKLGVEHESMVTTVHGVGYMADDTSATAMDYPRTDAEYRLDIDAALELDRSIDLFPQTL